MQFTNIHIKGRYQRFRQPGLSAPSEVFDQFVDTLLVFLVLIALHTFAMMGFEGLNFKDSLWLTMTSVTTVGYGDLSAKTDLGRLATIILIYVGGISLLAKLVAEYIDYRLEKRDRKIKGLWEWKNMKDHLLIINTPDQDAERYLKRLIEQIKITPALATLPIQILTDKFPDGLPYEVRDAGVVHVHGRPESGDLLDCAGIQHAKYILIIARNYTDPISDSINFDILDRIDDFTTTAYILAEVVDDANRKRFRDHGSDSVIRPIRAYPEIVTRALEAPGTEQVLENLFTHRGDYPQRYEVIVRNMKWAQVASRIVSAGLGTPLGYIDSNKKVHTNPKAQTQVNTDSLIILVHEDSTCCEDKITEALHG